MDYLTDPVAYYHRCDCLSGYMQAIGCAAIVVLAGIAILYGLNALDRFIQKRRDFSRWVSRVDTGLSRLGCQQMEIRELQDNVNNLRTAEDSRRNARPRKGNHGGKGA